MNNPEDCHDTRGSGISCRDDTDVCADSKCHVRETLPTLDAVRSVSWLHHDVVHKRYTRHTPTSVGMKDVFLNWSTQGQIPANRQPKLRKMLHVASGEATPR